MKRSREDLPAWWTTATEWVRSKSGLVHTCIKLSPERELVVTNSIKKDDILLEIPTAACISVHTVEATSLGKKLAASIRIAATEKDLYTQEQDLLVALFLASQKEYNSGSDQSFSPYLDTLPESYDMLPRRWDESELVTLLQGSELLKRVQKSKIGTADDYDRIRKAWKESKSKEEVFPSFSCVDNMLAAVTSRAFAGLGGGLKNDIAMVPLLDLCNHHRGDVRKNVSFRLLGDKVQVTAQQTLSPNDVLRITYGAQGNAQLLFNYGFCIKNNNEPDGSSNDIVEVQLKPGQKPVELQIGPKSYTFGRFIKALELFHEITSEGGGGGNTEEDEDDMEAFLNGCDEDEEVNWDENDEEEDDQSEKNAILDEVKALKALQCALESAKGMYGLHAEDGKEAKSPQQLSVSILISSEIRTIEFYAATAQRLTAKLEGRKDDAEDRMHFRDGAVERQVSDLVEAFLAIRYPTGLI